MKISTLIYSFYALLLAFAFSGCKNNEATNEVPPITENLFVRDVNQNVISELDPGLITFIEKDLLKKGRNEDIFKLKNTYDVKTGKLLKNVKIENNGSRINAAFSIVQDVHMQDSGWQYDIPIGSVVGTTTLPKRLEAFTLRLSDLSYNSQIQYEAFVQDIGWQGPKNAGITAGTVGMHKRIQGMRFSVSPTVATSVAYRAYQQDYGWLGWVGDGETAGNISVAKRIQAFQLTMLIY